MKYQEILDEIYSSYLSVKSLVADRLDSETRDPEIMLQLARDLSLFPERQNTITVTGSKGKGTVTRSIAALLQTVEPGKKIGLLISPHETEHTDRMRIQGQPIPQADFCRIYLKIRAALCSAREALKSPHYLSPSGTFLLVALAWFNENSVNYYVLECGRGAKHDEVGRIPAAVAVVTSIFVEHPEYLGPTVSDIARNKLAIGLHADKVVLGGTAKHFNDTLQIVDQSRVVLPHPPGTNTQSNGCPQWIAQDWELACQAVASYRGGDAQSLVPLRERCLVSASFFQRRIEGVELFFDGTISHESIDTEFVDHLLAKYRSLLVLISMSDDKDVDAVAKFFQMRGVSPRFIVIEGTEYLKFKRTERNYPDDIAFRAQISEPHSVTRWLNSYLPRQSYDAVYALGTQSFIRLCRSE